MRGQSYESRLIRCEYDRDKVHYPESLFLWYLFFGAMHEVSHLFAAWWLGYDVMQEVVGESIKPWARLAYEVILGRQCSLPNLPLDLDGPVRRAGWICSSFLAALLYMFCCSFDCFNHTSTLRRKTGKMNTNSEIPLSFFTRVMSRNMLVAAFFNSFRCYFNRFFGMESGITIACWEISSDILLWQFRNYLIKPLLV